MIIYNLTFNVENAVKDEWTGWMQNKILPALTNKNILQSVVMSELILEEPQGTSFSVQFFVETPQKLDLFLENHLPDLLASMNRKFGDKVVFFPTKMKILRRFNPD
jgi:hypothetical protein